MLDCCECGQDEDELEQEQDEDHKEGGETDQEVNRLKSSRYQYISKLVKKWFPRRSSVLTTFKMLMN